MEAIDTLAFAKKLKSAGLPDSQAEAFAEAQAEMFREMLDSKLATKDDLVELRLATQKDLAKLATKDDLAGLRGDMQQMETELRGDMQQIEAGLRGNMQQLETELRGDMHQMETGIRSDMFRLMLGQTIALIGVIFAAAALF